jgi:hypothetical protein
VGCYSKRYLLQYFAVGAAKYFAVTGTKYWHPKSEVVAKCKVPVLSTGTQNLRFVAKCKVPVLSTGTQNPRPGAKYLGSVFLPYLQLLKIN